MSMIWLSKNLLDNTLKAQAAKEKLDKLDFTIKNSCTFKGHYQESKPTELGEVPVSHIYYKGFSSRKYKDNLLELNNRKINNPILKS